MPAHVPPSDSQDRWGQSKSLLTGMTAASPTATPTPATYGGSSVRAQAPGGVTAPQGCQPQPPSTKPHASGEALPDRLQPSRASQSSNALKGENDPSQADASTTPPAEPRPFGPATSGRDAAAGTTTGKPQSVGRVGVESLGGLAWQLEGSDAEVEKQIYVAVFQLKTMIRDSRCAAMVSFPAGMPDLRSVSTY